MQHVQNNPYEEMIEEKTHAYFSQCPFCDTERSMNYEEDSDQRHLVCNDCGRRWDVIYTVGAIWLHRASNPQQAKEYTTPWMPRRTGRSLEGIRPYVLLETDCGGKQKVAEQGLDRFVWNDELLLDYFDEYDDLTRRHSCERVKIAFACARKKATNENEPTPMPGLSIRQVAAVTSLSEQEASDYTQRLQSQGLISYEIRPEKGSAGVEAFIVGFLGEPIYQMTGYTAEKTIRELVRMAR